MLLFVVCIFSSCANGQNSSGQELSTDKQAGAAREAKLRQELETADYSGEDLSTVEKVNAARERKLEKPLDSHSKGCVVIPKQLPDIILLGSFAFDLGCRLQSAIIKKRGVVMDKNLSRIALQSLDWEKADAGKRKELALNWVQFGLLAFGNPLTGANKDFTAQKFEEPQASSSEDGSVTVSLWAQRPAGMRCESGYDKFIYSFQKDGTLERTTTESSFSVPCK